MWGVAKETTLLDNNEFDTLNSPCKVVEVILKRLKPRVVMKIQEIKREGRGRGGGKGREGKGRVCVVLASIKSILKL